jgi:hypothetical protein
MTHTIDRGDIAGLTLEIADLRPRVKRARRIARHIDDGAADGIREHALALEARLRELETAIDMLRQLSRVCCTS